MKTTPVSFPAAYTLLQEIASAARLGRPDLVQQRVDALVEALLADGSYEALLGASLFASDASPSVRAAVSEAVEHYLHRALRDGWGGDSVHLPPGV